MHTLSRRDWLRQCTALAVAGASGVTGTSLAASKSPAGCTLSIGTYAMPGMPLEEAISLIAQIGYDGIEIAVRPDYDGAPARVPPDRRRDVRRLIDESGLKLTALMEDLHPAAADRESQLELERIKLVGQLANDLSDGRPPLLQTTLGGVDWEEKKNLFRDRLGAWIEITRAAGVVLAVKPHRGSAMSRPSEAIWLIRQLGDTPWLRMVYDYSHYAFRDMPMAETVATALPYTAHVAVKDAVEKDGRVEFQLPGQSGTFDYAALLRLLYEGGYRHDICCEVSAMVSRKPGYDPATAARICYRNVSQAFTAAGVPRTGSPREQAL